MFPIHSWIFIHSHFICALIKSPEYAMYRERIESVQVCCPQKQRCILSWTIPYREYSWICSVENDLNNNHRAWWRQIYLMCWKIPVHICGHLERKEIPFVQLSQLPVCFCLGVLIQNERIWPMPKSHTRLLLWGIWTMQHWQFLESQHLADNLFPQVHPQQPPDTCHMHSLENVDRNEIRGKSAMCCLQGFGPHLGAPVQ